VKPQLNKVYLGHNLEIMRRWPDAFVHCVVTSPPYYGLRAYGTEAQVWGGRAGCAHDWVALKGRVKTGGTAKSGLGNYDNGLNQKTIEAKMDGRAFKTPESSTCSMCGAWRGELGAEPTSQKFIEHLVDLFREVRRILRPDGTLWLNLGDSYNAAGRVGHGSRQGYKQQTNRASAAGVDVGRSTDAGFKPKDLLMIPARAALALQADGWYLRADIVWAKKNCMPESVSDRPTKSHEQIYLLTKSERYFWDAEAVREKADYAESEIESVRRGDFNGKTNAMKGREAFRAITTSRNMRDVWHVALSPFNEAHFATFPPDIPKRCILAGTSEHGVCSACGAPYERIVEKGESYLERQKACGSDALGGYDGEAVKEYAGTGAQNASEVKARILRGMVKKRTAGWKASCKCKADRDRAVVFDQFFGSGTTGLVAAQYGRHFIGTELNPEYLKIAEKRVANEAAQEKLL
jgi:DNA modification methylase